MSNFVQADRTQPFLLPPDLRDWLPENDLAHFVLEAVERVPMERFKVNVRGTGSAQYHPQMMLALLIYCYANGELVASLSGRGVDVLVAVGSDDKRRRHDFRPLVAAGAEKVPKAAWLRKMKEKMAVEYNRASYRLRQQTVEPVFSVIKQAMGFRQFLLRGKTKVAGEWQLLALAYNCKRLYNLLLA